MALIENNLINKRCVCCQQNKKCYSDKRADPYMLINHKEVAHSVNFGYWCAFCWEERQSDICMF